MQGFAAPNLASTDVRTQLVLKLAAVTAIRASGRRGLSPLDEGPTSVSLCHSLPAQLQGSTLMREVAQISVALNSTACSTMLCGRSPKLSTCLALL